MTNYCPNGHDLAGDPIPEEYLDRYGGKTHYSRKIGMEIRGVYDGVLYWICPDCGIAWQRWPEHYYIYDIAQPYIEAHNVPSV